MKRMLYRQHGRYSLELKFRYLIPKRDKKSKNSFDIRFFFFLPYSFNVNSDSYPKESFYEDQKLYLRFNTPSFSLQELADNPRSPFIRSRQLIEEAPGGAVLDKSTYLYETKLCGSVYKSTLRETYYRMRKKIRKMEPAQWRSELLEKIEGMTRLAQWFHDLTDTAGNLSEDICYHTKLVDEYISLELEKNLLWIYDLLRSRFKSPPAEEEIEAAIIAEMDYRRERGYVSVSESGRTGEDLEEYAYRTKILKRYTSDVLFFNVRRKAQGKRVEHILYAFAAGIAMVFATTIAFLGQTTFGNLSTSLFILLVASYMLKDRLKDIFRDLFRRSIGSFFYDRGVKVYDPHGRRKLCHIKERVTYVESAKLPSEIKKMRGRGPFEQFLAYTATENVLMYEKNIRLNSKMIRKLHTRVKGIADINILSLRRILHSLSVQYRSVPIVSGGRIAKVLPVKRIYHLNLIVWYQGDDAGFIERIRLIVDGKGIKRIEKVKSSESESLSAE